MTQYSELDRSCALAARGTRHMNALHDPEINYSILVRPQICLPPVEALDKLAIAQADVGRSFDFEAGKKFFQYTVPMLKGEIRLTDETMALAVSAQNQAADATSKEKLNFQRAGKKLESAAKQEKEKQAVARYKAEMAAKAAAKKAAS